MPSQPICTARYHAPVPATSPTSPSLIRLITRLLAEHDVSLNARDAVIACSGGVDSVVLVDLIAHLPKGSQPRTITVVHADHGLRDDGGVAREAARAAAARVAGATFLTIDAPAGSLAGANLQARARDWRRSELAAIAREFDNAMVLTGHHADDQLETVLYALVASSGGAPLTGMSVSATIDEVLLVRPLLAITRKEIETHAASRDLVFAHDPSNDDTSQFRRNVIRHNVVPELLGVHPGAGANLARAIERAREQQEALAAFAGATAVAGADAGIDDYAFDLRVLAGLPEVARREVLASWLRAAGDVGRSLSARNLAAVAQLAGVGFRSGKNVAIVQVGTACVRRDGYRLLLSSARPPVS